MDKRIENLVDLTLMPLIKYDLKNSEPGFYSDNIAIDTVDFLKFLAKHAVGVQFVPFYEDNDDAFNAIFGVDDYDADNSYNYSEPYTHALEVVTPTRHVGENAYTVAFCPHISGDVRCNYCEDYLVLTFRNFYEYVELCDDYFQSKAYTFELDGVEFTCHYGGSGEYFYLYSCDGFVTDAFIPEPYTKEDFIESAREAIA